MSFDIGYNKYIARAKSFKSRQDLVNEYLKDESRNHDIQDIVLHTIGKEEPLYEVKDMLKKFGPAVKAEIKPEQEFGS
jgi:hypothetical protein